MIFSTWHCKAFEAPVKGTLLDTTGLRRVLGSDRPCGKLYLVQDKTSILTNFTARPYQDLRNGCERGEIPRMCARQAYSTEPTRCHLGRSRMRDDGPSYGVFLRE